EKHDIIADISARIKQIISIYRKMQKTDRKFNEIHDILAVRVIVDTIPDCYKVLALAQQLYNPIQKEYDDYIQKPKTNGYQSLHILLEDKNKNKFELQVRTSEMHKTAEMGVAAHWKYKEGGTVSSTDDFFKWFREHSTNNRNGKGQKEFDNFFRFSKLKNDIYVLTPKGDLKRLSKGSTPIDFAFSIHKDIGFRCNGAKVNGQIVSFNRELHNGDVIEIMTSKQPVVNSDWTKYAKSPRALSEIRRWLRKQLRLHSIKLGEEILAKAFRRNKIPLTNDNILSAAKDFQFEDIKDLYASIGAGNISPISVTQKFSDNTDKIDDDQKEATKEIKADHSMTKSIKVGGIDNLMLNFGKCCLPIPGDPIVGYITRGKGVTIHRITCRNSKQILKEPEREIQVDWEHQPDKLYAAGLRVLLQKSGNFIKELTPLLGKKTSRLLTYQLYSRGEQDYCTMVVEVPDIKHLNDFIASVRNLKSVKIVTRLVYSDFKKLLKAAPVSLKLN
ncbi:RelA/SpoT family protein, partial [candidate division KSB1 bacterium]